ncbi:MAG: YceI family protein [Bacteroidetes bacterium]|nr:YceI family protein [Bacteroidota bacterium]
MKNAGIYFAILAAIVLTSLSAPPSGKYVTKSAHISFFSHTDIEDISANNYAVIGTIDPASGDVSFSVPMQSFEFEKALMQKHYNSPDFMDTKVYPKSKFKGTITNLSEINFDKDGTYHAKLEGEMTIKDVTKKVTEAGTITVQGNSITVDAKTVIVLADYHVAFEKGKPSTNIAKSVEVTVKAKYVIE